MNFSADPPRHRFSSPWPERAQADRKPRTTDAFHRSLIVLVSFCGPPLATDSLPENDPKASGFFQAQDSQGDHGEPEEETPCLRRPTLFVASRFDSPSDQPSGSLALAPIHEHRFQTSRIGTLVGVDIGGDVQAFVEAGDRPESDTLPSASIRSLSAGMARAGIPPRLEPLSSSGSSRGRRPRGSRDAPAFRLASRSALRSTVPTRSGRS